MAQRWGVPACACTHRAGQAGYPCCSIRTVGGNRYLYHRNTTSQTGNKRSAGAQHHPQKVDSPSSNVVATLVFAHHAPARASQAMQAHHHSW